MSLLKQALEALGNSLDDKADGWLDKLITHLAGLISVTEDEELRDGGINALRVLKDNQDKFISLGKRTLIIFVAHVAAGQNDEAAKEYYRSKASAREIIESILNDALDINEVRKQKEAIKKEALELVKILAKAAKFLLPLLLAL